MFDHTYKISAEKTKGQYNLKLPVDSDWAKKSQRVLVVLETVDTEDIQQGYLLANRSKSVLENLLKFSFTRAKDHGFDRRDSSFAAINFNHEKFMDKPKETWPVYKTRFKDRILTAIKELEPTHILICGDHAAESILSNKDIEAIPKKRGRVYDLKLKGVRVKVCTTLDLHPLYSPKKSAANYEDDDYDDDDGDITKDVYAKSNLMFYVSDHVQNLLCGRLVYDLSEMKAKPIYVDTIEKFNKLWKKIKTEPVIGVDTETLNLTVNHNCLHTIQFAFSKDKGYFLPFKHPETPFSKKEIAYIEKRLRKFFAAEPKVYGVKYLITQYGMFDLRVLRRELGIPVIHHLVWEISAGEYCLDENRTALAGSPFNTPHGGLEQIFMVYGNDHYKTAAFSKEDRSNARLTSLKNPDFIEYGAMDVQSIFGIHEMQKERARHLQVGDKPFLPYYRRLVLYQMSNTVHSLSTMMQKGSAIDKLYLALLKSNASPLLKLLNEARAGMLKSKEVKRANKLLLKEGTGQASHRGLFDSTLPVFNFGKQEHKALLFFNIMGLKPVTFTAHGTAQINKNFIAAYKDKVPLVETFGRYQKISKLWSTYVKGWWNKIQDSQDARKDWRLRASYGFFNVVTGRLNSYDPSLQQVPTRGSEAKYIKRAFIALPGSLLVKFDYSAHEIRVWSYVSGDEALAEAFKEGQRLRQKLYQAKSSKLAEKIKKALKKRGDVHIQNVKFFFDQWVDKDHFLRDAIKQVVFGVVYSKSAKSLAKDLKKPRAFAQELIDKMFARFKKGKKWLDWTKKHAEENYYTYSPIGMRRNLMGIMTGIPSIVSAMSRRAANSPIQGLASQIGVTASRLVTLELYKTLKHFGYITEETRDMPADILKAVHDALHSETPYEILIIFIHVLQWASTYGVTKYYKEKFGVEFTIEPEIEIEIGASEDNLHKWDWTEKGLEAVILQALKDQVAIKTLTDRSPEQVLKLIYKEYNKPKLRQYLDKHYPILGVTKS